MHASVTNERRRHCCYANSLAWRKLCVWGGVKRKCQTKCGCGLAGEWVEERGGMREEGGGRHHVLSLVVIEELFLDWEWGGLMIIAVYISIAIALTHTHLNQWHTHTQSCLNQWHTTSTGGRQNKRSAKLFASCSGYSLYLTDSIHTRMCAQALKLTLSLNHTVCGRELYSCDVNVKKFNYVFCKVWQCV